MTTPSETAKIGVPIALARSIPACSTPQRYPKLEVKMPLVGMTWSGCCIRASRWARSLAKGMPRASSSLCTAAFAAGWTAITWAPRIVLPPAPPVSADAFAVSTASVLGVSAWLVAAWAAAATAPAAIAEMSSRPLAVLAAALDHTDDVGDLRAVGAMHTGVGLKFRRDRHRSGGRKQ